MAHPAHADAASIAPPMDWSQTTVAWLTAPSKPLLALYGILAAGFMVCFLQGDVLYNAFVANALALGHVNVYSYFQSHPAIRYIDTVMPPLFYVVTGAYLKLLMLIHLDPVSSNPADLYLRLVGHHKGIQFSLGLLALKIPNLAAVIAGVFLSRRLALLTDADEGVVSLLWVASPALIVTALMQAQNDAIPAAITLAALVALKTKSPVWTMLLLGLAACFKSYALVLVPVTALLLSNRNVLTTIRYGLLGIIPPAVAALPFLGSAFIGRVLGAHDGNTLFGTSYTGRLPTHLWPVIYVGVLIMAWIMSKQNVDLIDLISLWFITLGMIFVVNWWVPQWVVWLLPMAIVFAARDRIFAWMWLATNALVLAHDLINFPGNMDGAMLMPFYGDKHHSANSHVYDYHLYQLWHIVPYAVLDGVYIALGVAFLALTVRAVQWAVARRHVLEEERTLDLVPNVAMAALIGPLLLAPYIGVMIAQRLVG